MIQNDRRRYPRYEAKVGATISTTGHKIQADLVDISEGGFGVISEKAIEPGTKVSVSLELKGNFTIQGTVIWSSYICDDDKNHYRMGIETERIILKDIKAIGFPEKSELVAQIIFQIKKQGIKVVEKYSP